MMDAPGKRLLLIDEKEATAADSGFSLTGSTDLFRTSEGDVIYLAEFNLDWLDEAYDRQMQQWAEEIGDEEARQYASQQIEGACKARQAVQSGELLCCLSYSVVEYTEGMDDLELYTGGEHGVVHFVIRPRAADGNV